MLSSKGLLSFVMFSQRLRSGTTAVVAAIYEQVLHLAWVGDSQAVLIRNGVALDVSDTFLKVYRH